MTKTEIFVAYSSEPEQVADPIEEAAQVLRNGPHNLGIETWRQSDTAGRFIVEGVMEKIDVSDCLVADITRLNFNVTFEVGYAIGRSKRVIPILNESLSPPKKQISQIGIYDTIGYESYENTNDLVQYLSHLTDHKPLIFQYYPIDHSAPVYILDTKYRTNASVRIVSKVKKGGFKFRSFDPSELPRLSTLEAYRNVKQSVAVIVHLLPSVATDFEANNLRGAFISGLCFGLEKELLLLQGGDDHPVPIDYRDLVSVYKHPSDIDRYISQLAPKIIEGLQVTATEKDLRVDGLLANLDLGAPAAENEMSTLGQYYFPTDAFNKALGGSIRLAVGRKGSGKTALFFQVRDNIRKNKRNIVLDLKPEGHQLHRFKTVLGNLGKEVQEHVASAFWEYVLLLEICHKIFQKDYRLHTRDHDLYGPYRRLEELYAQDDLVQEGDFSERILRLVTRITDEFDENYELEKLIYLSVPQVNQVIYRHDIPNLREELAKYLKLKESLWILFDNIDKGWPTRGVEISDIIILRALLDATRNIERFLSKKGVPCNSLVVVRNDVYELLVDETPDRGKESRVSLDWTDPTLLRQLLLRRLEYGGLHNPTNFDEAWNRICVSHIDGENSAQYLIDRSLMRPRNLLTLLNHCKSNAVNLGHSRIEEEDVKRACQMYSADIGNEIGLEIRDVFSHAKDILYYFIGAHPVLTLGKVRDYLNASPVPELDHVRLIEILMWFGFFGIKEQDSTEIQGKFIYDVYYDMKKLRRLAHDFSDDQLELVIQCAFWPFLEITFGDRGAIDSISLP
ncbi:MAG: P-loop ATPase, Sll1717 family [Desulfomonilaceae bacterium]